MRWLRIAALVLAGCAGTGAHGTTGGSAASSAAASASTASTAGTSGASTGATSTSGSGTTGASDARDCHGGDVGVAATGSTTGNFLCGCGESFSCPDGTHFYLSCGPRPLSDGGEISGCTCTYRDGGTREYAPDRSTCCDSSRCGFWD